MKKYSEIIESLKLSGSAGVESKAADLSTTARKTVAIKGDPAKKSLPLSDLVTPPAFDKTDINGGLSQSFFG